MAENWHPSSPESRERQLTTKEHQAHPISCSLSPKARLLSLARKPKENKQQQAQTECGNLSRNPTRGASSTLSKLFPQPKGEATKSAGTGLGVSQQQKKGKTPCNSSCYNPQPKGEGQNLAAYGQTRISRRPLRELRAP